MKILYLDCFSGISGDMFLAALLDLGVPLEVFRRVAEQLQIPVEIGQEEVSEKGLRATRLVLRELDRQPEHRSLKELLQVLEQGSLEAEIRAGVEQALWVLAEAEARAHGIEAGSVHFHEIGGLDTLIDLACARAGLKHLGVSRVYSSPLPLGRGSIRTAHGLIPLPAPATMQILLGVPTYGIPLEAELVTPTGAALATTLAEGFGPPPAAIWQAVGHGAGRQQLPQPNLLRLWLGEQPEPPCSGYEHDQVLVMETQIDDLNPEFLPHLRRKLEEEGAIDVTMTPTIMKKGRPGTIVTALAPREQLLPLAQIFFRESSALGLRWYPASRIKLHRASRQVATPYGAVRVKVGYLPADKGGCGILNLAPEYEDCSVLALEAGVSIKEVYQAALVAAKAAFEGESQAPIPG